MRKVLLFSIIMMLLAACSPAANLQPVKESASDALQVTVSILPQKYFVERIAGDHVNVNVMVLPGANPETYEPKPEQMAQLSESAAYFSIGVPFETTWLDKIAAANPSMLMVDTASGIERIPMVEEHSHEGETGQADPVGGDQENLDPHIWLSPELVKIQAVHTYDAMVSLDPSNQAEYQKNLDAFTADIDALENDIQNKLSNLKSNKFIVFHPSWGYFARDFGLEQIPVQIGGQDPSAQEMAELIDEAKLDQVQVIFAQPEFSTTAAETIAQEIGGKVLLISPLSEDWLDNLKQVSQTFADVLNK